MMWIRQLEGVCDQASKSLARLRKGEREVPRAVATC